MSESESALSSPRLTVVEMAEIAGGLAHELRNPLSTMMVNLKLLEEDLQNSKASVEDVRRRSLLKVEVLRREAERLQALFDDFLNLTRSYQLQKRNCDLRTIAARLMEFYEPMLRGGRIRIRVDQPDSPVVAAIDEKLISQALLNLVINAGDAMSEGGEITLRTAGEGPWTILGVSDTGMGIAEEDQDRIFRPFYTTKGKGAGLGLPIARRIVQEHGGELTFTSAPGQGATFTIRLPREITP